MRPLLLLLVLTAFVAPAVAQPLLESHESRLTRLERKVNNMDTVAGGSLLCAVICALWAQNTARNSWLWFFLGLIFSLIALFVMLYKNAEDLKARTRMTRPPAHP